MCGYKLDEKLSRETDSEQREPATMQENESQEERERRQAEREARRLRINSEVSAVVRAPFARLIADYLSCAPSAESIQTFADKYPDRFAAALAQLAPLAGYRKEINVSGEINVVSELPDSQLSNRLLQAEAKLDQLRKARQLGMNPQPIADAILTDQNAPQAVKAHESDNPFDHYFQRNQTANKAQEPVDPDSQANEQGESESPNDRQESEGSTFPSLTRLDPRDKDSAFDATIIDA